MFYYKVVLINKIDGEKHSFNYGNCHCIGNSNLVYKRKQWTKKHDDCGPLAVFDTLENAMYFCSNLLKLNYNFKWQIWRCEIVESEDQQKQMLYYTDADAGEKIKLRVPLPQGTIFADKVKLVKRIVDINCSK